MKKFTKILSCLTAAALICSAGALSACGSVTSGGETGDNTEENIISDVVTEDEWNAAFADENFYNVTINFDCSYAEESNSTIYYGDNNASSYEKENESRDCDGTYKYDLTLTSEILTGNIYSYENAKEENQYQYENADYPEHNQNTDETVEYTNYLYFLFDEQGFNDAAKSVVNGVEGEWHIDDFRSLPLYAGYYGAFAMVDAFLLRVIGVAFNYNDFEYKDGAYVYTYAYDESHFIEENIEEDIIQSGYEYDVTEFTGGVITYSVIIKDGKVYSLKYDYSYTFGLNVYYSVFYESYSQTYEWIFSDYGTTSVTVPDEVTALFN